MNSHDAFHCKIDISRNLPNNVTVKDTLHNTLSFFFDHTPTPFLSIGSTKKSSIIVEGAQATHCTFNFQHDSMLIKAYGNIIIRENGNEISLQQDDIYTLRFNDNKVIEAHTLLEWCIEIQPHAIINVTVTSEEGYAKDGLEHYLSEKYEFAKKISESERYLIYKVSDNSAVKILHPYHKQEQLQVMEFFKVARSIKQIQSDILCDIKSFDETLPHVEIEYFAGQSLQNYLAKKGKLSYNESMLVFRRILVLLRETSKGEYICKNLHLDNILCGRDKQVKFIGWNTALDGAFTSRHALYLAPEYTRGERVATSADIYSAGIILYRMITGRFPFASAAEYQERVENNQPITSLELQASSVYITPQTANLLEKLLDFLPQNRPFIDEIESFAQDIHDVKLWENVLNMDEQQVFYGLQIVASPQPICGEICPLKDNQSFIIGRKANINIPGDTHISRQHTKIILQNGVCTLEDLGSSNGTKILGEKMSKCEIDSGVTFEIGQTTLGLSLIHI